jgi:hypothetical protein
VALEEEDVEDLLVVAVVVPPVEVVAVVVEVCSPTSSSNMAPSIGIWMVEWNRACTVGDPLHYYIIVVGFPIVPTAVSQRSLILW